MKHLLHLLLLLSVFSVSAQNLQKGIELYDNKEPEEANKTLSVITPSEMGYAQAQFYLGRIAFDKKVYDQAREHFENAIEAEPSNASYYTWLGNTIGTMSSSVGRIKQARLAPKIRSAYEKAVALDPQNISAHWGLVRYYTQAPGFLGGSWSKAEATARAIGELDPLEGHMALIEVYTRKDAPELVEKEYLKAIKLAPTRMANLGIFYQNQGWYDKAFDIFQRAFAQFPDDMNLLYQVGRTSALSGKRPQLGLNSLEQYLAETDAATAAPSHAGAKMRLAMIYEKQGNVSKAKTLYKAALASEPDMEEAKKGMKRVN